MPKKRWFKGKYPPAVVETFVCSVFLEELGYELGTEVWVEVSNVAYLILETEEKRATIFTGIVESEEEFSSLLESLMQEELSDQETKLLFNKSKSIRNMPKTIIALREAGFIRALHTVFHEGVISTLH
jgi:hypothetical protein